MTLFVKDMQIGENYLLRVGGWTEERYFREAPETRIVEFEDGELIMHSPATIRHQKLVAFLTFLLRGYVRDRHLGEILNGPAVVRLRPDLDYEPDIFFVPTRQLGQLAEECFSGTPAFIAEVISPGSRNHDLKTKTAAYREHGVLEYWTVDPEKKQVIRRILADEPLGSYRTTEHTKGRLESAAIPGFWMDVGWLWSEPLPSEPKCLERIFSPAH